MILDGLSGRTVLVTAPAGAIGLGIARAFAAAGSDLHMLAEDEAIFEAAASLGATGHRADITSTDNLAAVARALPVLTF